MPPLSKVTLLSDNVHGSIRVPALVKRVMDTPEVQRLRKLQQLGLSHLVYPTGNHSRFEHSLGVSHLAGTMVECLRKQTELGITDVDVLCVRLAGLLHDLGHGPFSHTWELFVHSHLPSWKLEHEDASINMLEFMLHGDVEDTEEESGRRKELRDELEKAGLTPRDLVFIKECIRPPKDKSPAEFKGREPGKHFLYEIVSNSLTGYDVDKFDYFLRDSLGTGVSIPFNRAVVDRYINDAVVMDIAPGQPRICFPTKFYADQMLEDIGVSRMQLYNKVYHHKTTVAYEVLLLRALRLAHQGGFTTTGPNGVPYTLVGASKHMRAYLRLTDSVLDLIAAANPDVFPDPAKIREAQSIISVQIPYREHPKLVVEAPNNTPKQFRNGLHVMPESVGLGDSEGNVLVKMAEVAERQGIPLSRFNPHHLFATVSH